MPIQSIQFQLASRSFANLIAEAEATGVRIREDALPFLAGALTTYYAVSPEGDQPQAAIRERDLRESWVSMLSENQGRILLLEDIWRWIKKICPDYVQALRNANVVAKEV
jgi:hypothetical protein